MDGENADEDRAKKTAAAAQRANFILCSTVSLYWGKNFRVFADPTRLRNGNNIESQRENFNPNFLKAQTSR